ncbi:MAG: hypothetical protein WCK73_09860 [Deltaproteobacteria bacterium]
MDPNLKSELVKGLVQASATVIGGCVVLFLGWLILRSQERVKREEELRASMRRLRVDTLAHEQFLLGPLGNTLSECLDRMAKAETAPELSDAVAALHAALEKWIPPLEPLP